MPSTPPGSSSPLTVAEEIRLIAGAKHGDHDNFQTLVELYMGKAIGVAMGYTRNRDDAIDIAQDAFYRVYRHLDRFREGERFAPWFFRILRNCCLTFVNKRKRSRQVSMHPSDDNDSGISLVHPGPAPSGRMEDQEASHQIWTAMEQLPLKHREILLLRHFEDLDYSGIATILEIPVGTVMSRLYHARKKMQALMEPHAESQT